VVEKKLNTTTTKSVYSLTSSGRAFHVQSQTDTDTLSMTSLMR